MNPNALPAPPCPSFSTLLDGFLHPTLRKDDESLRRGRLQICFGLLGGSMAVAYSAFFFFLQHYWGGVIVAVSGIALIQIPWIVRQTGNLNFCGHVYGAVLVLCFAGLCAMGGGLQGPTSAWLAVVPVCALLLMGLRSALSWSALCFAAMVALAVLDLKGVEFPRTYALESESAIASASRIGLVVFLAFLGLLYEQTRIQAFGRVRESNERLALANRELTDLNRQKNEFLNIAAHDLKNPLSIICGYADLLRELESPTLKQIRDQASVILRSGNHMLDIIRNILDVRAIEDGHRRLARKRCPIQDPIAQLLTDYGPAAERKKITLIDTVSSSPPEAWADPGAVYQVLDNLISNAIKYTPRGGTVSVELTSTDDRVTVTVQDSGPGLSEADQELLWGKFVRLTPRPTGDESANGLGLWIVRRLAEEMGGTTFCESRLGEGSAFGVHLPRWAGQPETSAESGHDSAGEILSAADFDRLVGEIEARGATGNREDRDASDLALPG